MQLNRPRAEVLVQRLSYTAKNMHGQQLHRIQSYSRLPRQKIF